MSPRSIVPILALAPAFALFTGCGKKKEKSGADDTPPEAGQLLTVTSAGTASVHLSWAAATDDESEASALEYLAYHSTANDLNGVANVEANGTPSGAFAAAITETEVTGLDPDTDYWFSVIVRDEAGNKAAYTAVPATTSAGCAAALPIGGCPAAAMGKVTVCGRLADIETDAFLEAPAATGAACPGSATADGPCSVSIRFYDALDFASNPAGATPIVPESLYVDDCGRYRATNLTPPSLGYLAAAVDDASGTSDRHRLTAVAEATANAADLAALRTFVTRIETDTAWSTGAGLAGPSFADLGVVAAVFRWRELGRAGVQITRNGSASTADDYYFSDASAARSTVAAGQAVTGTNGGALFLGSSLVDHSGTGGEPPACQWPSRLVASIPGVVFVTLLDAETGAGAACP